MFAIKYFMNAWFAVYMIMLEFPKSCLSWGTSFCVLQRWRRNRKQHESPSSHSSSSLCSSSSTSSSARWIFSLRPSVFVLGEPQVYIRCNVYSISYIDSAINECTFASYSLAYYSLDVLHLFENAINFHMIVVSSTRCLRFFHINSITIQRFSLIPVSKFQFDPSSFLFVNLSAVHG